MKQYVKVLAGRPQLYIVPEGATELTDEQVAWMLARPHVTTLEEILAMQEAPPPPPSLDELKVVKMRELDAWNAAAIAAGYTDAEGRTWGIADRDRAAWQELLTAAVQLLVLGESDTLPTPIREADGVTMHTVSLAEYRAVLRGVAQTYMQIDATYAALRAAILAAQDEAALDVIEIPGIATP